MGSSAYNPSISSLFVGTGGSSCDENDAKTGEWMAEGRTVLRGGDLMALMREVGFRGAGAARLALSARSTATNPNGSESEALVGVPRWYSYRAVAARSVDGGKAKGELGGRDEGEREQSQLGGSAG
jgi:hypothetical protein